MFNSEIKGNQRCNGFTSISFDQIVNCKANHFQTNNRLVINNNCNNLKRNDKSSCERVFIKKSVHLSTVHNVNNSVNNAKVKLECTEEQDFEDKITAHSIIGLSEAHKYSNILKQNSKLNNNNNRTTHHETLQRLNAENNVENHYQHHWFSASLEKFKLEDKSREERIEITRHEFQRYIQQLVRSNVGQPNKFPTAKANSTTIFRVHDRNKHQTGYSRLVAPKRCEIAKCTQPALPCTKHCTLHIMSNTDQVLFNYCTAKFADNTQCSMPVFDITHELPLCSEHARKRDNYKLFQEAKPKKIRKKVKPSAMIRPQKRSKKRRKAMRSGEMASGGTVLSLPISEDLSNGLVENSPEIVEEDMHIVDQVLDLNESDGLEQALVTQAHLLEETDINTVLSTIQVDEFSDFFTVNRNGEYEPSREETEELEKALAAVDNDVKSLEKLSQSQGLLDSLLDEHALAETLVIPDMFHGNYTNNTPSCGDNMVTQTSSYLLPIEPHSHS